MEDLWRDIMRIWVISRPHIAGLQFDISCPKKPIFKLELYTEAFESCERGNSV